MGLWDVFRSDRLEADRSVSSDDIRAALARGDYRDDDLVRPVGTQEPWRRIGDVPVLAVPIEEPPAPEATPDVAPGSPGSFAWPDDDEDDDPEWEDDPRPAPSAERPESSVVALPVLPDEEAHRPDVPELDDSGWLRFGADAGDEEDDEASTFTLARGGTERVEELDLAAMVDVAFQLVLFFLVTATTVMFKTLEVPRPADDKPPEVVAQGRPKPIEELEKDFILVEVDASGGLKVDHQPVPADFAALTARLREAKETGRTTMLLSADYAAPHRDAVLVYDAASEVNLQVAVASPVGAAPP